MTDVTPEQAAEYHRQLHARYAPGLQALQRNVDFEPLEQRFATYVDPLGLGQVYPIPEWALAIDGVHHALRAARYRLAAIAQMEIKAEAVLQTAVDGADRLQTQSNSSIALPDLTFEYEAYLFDVRRCLAFLERVVAHAFEVEPPKSGSKLPKAIAATPHVSYQPFVTPTVDELRATVNALPGYFDENSHRNTATHIEPVHAGSFQMFLDPGKPPRIGIAEGGHALPGRADANADAVRLSNVLLDELQTVEDRVFAVLEALPRPNRELEANRLPGS